MRGEFGLLKGAILGIAFTSSLLRARSDNFFSVEEVAELAGAVASGLAALHAQRIMHRDVKVCL